MNWIKKEKNRNGKVILVKLLMNSYYSLHIGKCVVVIFLA